MADPANGNGSSPSAASVVAACGANVNLPPVLANGRPGTVFGPDPNYVQFTGTQFAQIVLNKMTQFLAADPNRIGLYLRSQLAGVRVTTMQNGLGVPIGLTMGNSPIAGGTFVLMLWGPNFMLVSPWFWGVADVIAPPGPTGVDQLLTWIEWYKA